MHLSFVYFFQIKSIRLQTKKIDPSQYSLAILVSNNSLIHYYTDLKRNLKNYQCFGENRNMGLKREHCLNSLCDHKPNVSHNGMYVCISS